MEKKSWKIIAIIFIILFSLQFLFNIYAFLVATNEERKINECYYDVCRENADAWYEDDVCYCYDYDLFGELVIADTKYMK